jgi:hypothetical protein
MGEDESGVAVAQWTCEAQVPAIGAVRRGVGRFARRHGMTAELRRDLDVAIAATLADAAGHLGGRVMVDVATDGSSLSVRVTDARAIGPSTDPLVALPLLVALADRVETGDRAGGTGSMVLMEFPMTASGRPDAGVRGRDRGARRLAAAPATRQECHGEHRFLAVGAQVRRRARRLRG